MTFEFLQVLKVEEPPARAGGVKVKSRIYLDLHVDLCHVRSFREQ